MKNNGFSLLELSIVLVIIGLIAGGIVAGASMIRAAELRSVITQQEQIKTSVFTFRDKYLSLPGDMKNAVKFWGAHAGGTSDGVDTTCSTLDETSPATGTETCNGDGNGRLGTTGLEVFENLRAYQHLSNAGLIEGSFTGVHGGNSTYHSVPGENVLQSKINGAGFSLYHQGVSSAGANWFDGSWGNNIYFGSEGNGGLFNPIITAQEAWNIDSKLDDGKPATGSVASFKSTSTFAPNCTTTAVSATAEYNIADDAILCSIAFTNVF